MPSSTLQTDFEVGALVKRTQSICPQCLQSIEAGVYERNGQVWMDKTCAQCGPFSAILSSDSALYLRTPAANEPTAGCGCGSGGCGSAIDNHSCVLLVEITQKCNLTCPTCYAASSPENDHFLSLDEYTELLDTLLGNSHGDADALQISGGEPTLHPDLIEMIGIAYEKGFRQVYLNTNGVRLSQYAFAESLSKIPRKISIYLQFDGVANETYASLRGNERLSDVKRKALRNCEELGIEVIPVMTLTKGINDCEVKEFFKIATSSPSVNKVMIQPAMYSGRYVNPRRLDRLTVADAIKLVAAQSGIFDVDDFSPIPCGDPNCFRMALAIRAEGKMLPVSRYFPKYEKWTESQNAERLESITDTFDSPDALAHALSMSGESEALANLDDDEVDALLDTIADVSENKGNADWRGLFAVGIKPFMDAYTYDQDRIDGCCTHIAARDGTPVSFCQYNAINRAKGNL